jgi:uncharacterized membrane protein
MQHRALRLGADRQGRRRAASGSGSRDGDAGIATLSGSAIGAIIGLLGGPVGVALGAGAAACSAACPKLDTARIDADFLDDVAAC